MVRACALCQGVFFNWQHARALHYWLLLLWWVQIRELYLEHEFCCYYDGKTICAASLSCAAAGDQNTVCASSQNPSAVMHVKQQDAIAIRRPVGDPGR
jgi:hypothetical protein